MKKYVAVTFILIFFTMIISGCSNKEDNFVFTAEITAVNEKSIEIKTTDDVSFDRAVVYYSDKIEPISFNLIVRQNVRITALPYVAESYPVQITAVAIELIEQK